jgi:hypothetical protein
MTPSPHGPYALGYTDATMVDTKSCQPARGSQSQKVDHSSDCSLKFDCMKLELLVNACQIWRVEYVLGSCTHRLSSYESWEYPNVHRFWAKGRLGDCS